MKQASATDSSGTSAVPGRRRKPGRPRSLDRDAVVRAAIRIADREGIGKLTMGRVAADLDVAVMTLYTYVSTKDALVDSVLEAVVAEATRPVLPANPAAWKAVVVDAFVDFREILVRHWKIVEPSAVHKALSLLARGWLEALLQVLDHAGFDPRTRTVVYRELLGYLLGDLQLRADHVLVSGANAAARDLKTYPLVAATSREMEQVDSRDGFVAGLVKMLAAYPDCGADSHHGRQSIPAPRDSSDPSAQAHLTVVEDAPAESRPSWAANPRGASADIRQSAISMVMDIRGDYCSEAAAIASVASRLGIPRAVLLDWMVGPEDSPDPDDGSGAENPGELGLLRREVAELRRANLILKNSVSFSLMNPNLVSAM